MEDKLKEYGLHTEHSEAIDREPIDFEIRTDDTDELCATVWGSEPWYDVQIDCNHTAVKYGDDDEQGECVICGEKCDWHWEEYADGDRVLQERVPQEWYFQKKIGGIVGEYLKELQKKW